MEKLKALFNRGFEKAAVVGGLGVGSLVSAGAANAAIDTTAITATITDVVTAAGVIGVAVLAMHYGIKAYKWMKQAG